MTKDRTIDRHTFSVLVDNEPGVLARVIGLFSGRGYNIESLTVAEVDAGKGLSRISIVTSGTLMVLEQIHHQLERLVPIHAVKDLTAEGRPVEALAVLEHPLLDAAVGPRVEATALTAWRAAHGDDSGFASWRSRAAAEGRPSFTSTSSGSSLTRRCTS